MKNHHLCKLKRHALTMYSKNIRCHLQLKLCKSLLLSNNWEAFLGVFLMTFHNDRMWGFYVIYFKVVLLDRGKIEKMCICIHLLQLCLYVYNRPIKIKKKNSWNVSVAWFCQLSMIQSYQPLLHKTRIN